MFDTENNEEIIFLRLHSSKLNACRWFQYTADADKIKFTNYERRENVAHFSETFSKISVVKFCSEICL